MASLLARIDRLLVQIAARDERIDELLAVVKASNAPIAELEAKLGGPTPRCGLRVGKGRTPSGRRPSRSARSIPGVTRKLAEKPDATRGSTPSAYSFASSCPASPSTAPRALGDHRHDFRAERRAIGHIRAVTRALQQEQLARNSSMRVVVGLIGGMSI
jgi:hypothetical protein